jgi:nucleotide-binding universal stress UspA family protein
MIAPRMRIVVGSDGSPSATAAVDYATRLASSLGATLHVVCAYKPVIATGGAPLAVTSPGAQEHAEEVVETARRRAGEQGVPVEGHAVAGSAGQALVDVADTHDAEMIVVGGRGMRGARRVMGSVPNHVSHHANCVVVIVPTQ